MIVTESEPYPNEQYIISKIQALSRYAETEGISTKLLDQDEKEIIEGEAIHNRHLGFRERRRIKRGRLKSAVERLTWTYYV